MDFGAFPFCPEGLSDFNISSELEDSVLCQLFRKPVEERQKWVLIHYKKYVSWKNAVSHSFSKKYITDHNHLLVNSDLVYGVASLAVGSWKHSK